MGGVALLVIVCIFAIIQVRQKRLAALYEAKFMKPAPDQWEYDPNSLELGGKLGEGAFGVVMAGTVTNIRPDLKGKIKVAVKLCGTNATVSEKNDFISECELMKKFAQPWHPNVCPHFL